MTGRPDANDVLRSHGEAAVRNGLDRARQYDPAVHTIEPGGDEQPAHEGPAHIPFESIDVWDLIHRSEPPKRIWQVEGWIPGDDVCLLGGDGGAGKTTLALQLAYSTTIGHPWLGLSVRLGPALYLTAEETSDEINFRMRCIRESIRSPIQPQSFRLISRAEAPTSHLVASHRGTIVPTPHLAELVAEVDRVRPVLTVLDASADLFGGDEIKRAEVRSFIAILRSSIAIPYKCCVLLLTHPSVSGIERGSGYSGSTAWNNSARSRLYFDQPHKDDPDARVLDLQKNNRGKTGEKIQLRWSNGYYITQSRSAAQDAAKLAKAKQVFMDLLRRYEGQGRVVSDKKGRNLASAVFAEEPEAKTEGLSSDLLNQAMIALFAEGRIEVTTIGRPGREIAKIVEVRGVQ